MISEKNLYLQKVMKIGKIMISVKANDFFSSQNEDLQKEISLLKRVSNWYSILKTPLTGVPLIFLINKAKKQDVDGPLTVLFEANWRKDASLA